MFPLNLKNFLEQLVFSTLYLGAGQFQASRTAIRRDDAGLELAPLRHADRFENVCYLGDSVAKVALPKVSKFLRAAGAFFV